MNRHAFIEEAEKRFYQLFRSSKNGNIPSAEERNRLEGFIDAGVFMGMLKADEVDELIERVHYSVFNMTMEEHRVKHAPSWVSSAIDYSYYDSPTFERSQQSKS